MSLSVLKHEDPTASNLGKNSKGIKKTVYAGKTKLTTNKKIIEYRSRGHN